MSTPQFTPGPYHYGFDYDENESHMIVALMGGGSYVIGKVFEVCPVTEKSIPREQAVANADLIAAAPDMYAALEVLLSLVLASGAVPSLPDVKNAQAALAKARGEGGKP